MIDEKSIIRKYVGIPFKHKGRSLEGIDCWGLLKSIYEDIGKEVYDPGIDYKIGWGERGENFFLENYYKQWKEVKQIQRFDVVLLKNKKGIANHVGVYISNGRFLQCMIRTGVVLSWLMDYKDKIYGYYRMIDNDNN